MAPYVFPQRANGMITLTDDIWQRFSNPNNKEVESIATRLFCWRCMSTTTKSMTKGGYFTVDVVNETPMLMGVSMLHRRSKIHVVCWCVSLGSLRCWRTKRHQLPTCLSAPDLKSSRKLIEEGTLALYLHGKETRRSIFAFGISWSRHVRTVDLFCNSYPL